MFPNNKIFIPVISFYPHLNMSTNFLRLLFPQRFTINLNELSAFMAPFSVNVMFKFSTKKLPHFLSLHSPTTTKTNIDKHML